MGFVEIGNSFLERMTYDPGTDRFLAGDAATGEIVAIHPDTGAVQLLGGTPLVTNEGVGFDADEGHIYITDGRTLMVLDATNLSMLAGGMPTWDIVSLCVRHSIR